MAWKALISSSPSTKTITPPISSIDNAKLQSVFHYSPTRTKRTERMVLVRCSNEERMEEKRSFLSLEEAGLVEMSGLDTHERFLCRLTISSLNLLRVISEEEGFPIEELNAGRICDWFVKDKLKREQDIDSAVLQWDNPDFQL
ncbi:uncharacterized protein LOC18431670 [Amborella trichopoda]|uniref:Receptor-interacting protein n=1 Tax=Amborella trichopoda TaxID=13333 RepID=W1P762_AMBTC|nr:uncharacterized protein LOC18431670 [Amborella trichopoda]ERN03524.1 hypothetical protein AMTR_s00003p00270950 [Amborella trichopoda]|eukprot:XP_006841849.1 uncharacterized protein LOC18431670 [Amborella trichopoda]